MEIQKFKIEKNQYLSDIWDFIPSNCMIHKSLPGIGATTLEINCNRNSIIIEPNVPVIVGKRNKEFRHEILGVIEGVTFRDVITYLESDREYKKILVTPESYFKVQKAFKQLGINYFEEYFMLFDECERITQDVHYRETIDAPIDDFWKFRNRSFISATAITSSSYKFNDNHFQHILIQPNFDSKRDLNLFITPNVLATVKEVFNPADLDRTNNECYCFFINCVDMIHCIIKDLKIKEFSNIYCSVDASKKLKELQYENVFSNLNEMNKINFLTSRFFSAVDIELDFQPKVIIVTDAKFAPQSKVIPYSESRQIPGRFRNGIRSFTHISNIDDTIPFISTEDQIEGIKHSIAAYNQIYTLYETASNENARTVLKEALERVEIAKLLDKDGQINSFKYDNALVEQDLKNTYYSKENLLAVYEGIESFNVNCLDLSSYKFEDYKFFYRPSSTKKKRWKDVVDQLNNIDLSSIDDNIYDIGNLERTDRFIVACYLYLGKDFIESVNYDEPKLIIALAKKSEERGEALLPFIDVILDTFRIDVAYSEKEIKEKLTLIYSEFDIQGTPSATDLEKFFNLSQRLNIRNRDKIDGKVPKGYRILSAKFTKKK